MQKRQVKSNFNLMSHVENQLKFFLGLKRKNISNFLYVFKAAQLLQSTALYGLVFLLSLLLYCLFLQSAVFQSIL